MRSRIRMALWLGLTPGFAVQPPAAAQVPLNDTGIITCYDATSATGTVSAATPNPVAPGFAGQDCVRGAAAADARGVMVKIGGSSAPGRDYTKIANDGSELPASAMRGPNPRDWGCTRDNITGLIWELKEEAGLRSELHLYSWYDTNPAVNGGNPGTVGDATACGGTLPACNTSAFRTAVNALQGSARLCGATDWRLPTPGELRSIVYLGATSSPTIDTVWFPQDFAGISVWTGTNFNNAGDPGAADAWVVRFGLGDSASEDKSWTNAIRLVRGGP